MVTLFSSMEILQNFSFYQLSSQPSEFQLKIVIFILFFFFTISTNVLWNLFITLSLFINKFLRIRRCIYNPNFNCFTFAFFFCSRCFIIFLLQMPE
ncbi:hypothetical protein HanXRQr2_Chr14g0638661 [Helianthus annuus]|uniref:Uncharacterized protein n=1 Tax=Helianthus annuus TaxID=4232 RepID=A0A251TRR9_HELAN|nr:hypothetical protein HanXRQr2_Chr14g0638661 [Helianthus annuus]